MVVFDGSFRMSSVVMISSVEMMDRLEAIAVSSGETPVPLPELGLLAASLGYEFEDFTDTSGPVGEWIATQRAEQELGGLPRSLKDFIADPQSRSYLELAQRLSEISTEKLRALAKALTDLLD